MVQSEIRPDRVAIYIRWSTDDQGDGTTLEVQREGCRHYALSQGWQYGEALTFIDDGYSGGSMDRPALTRLREAVRQGQVDCVVVFKIDRLSRNVVDTVNLVLREWDGLCHVKSAREAIDTTTQQGKMFFYTLVSFAEWERSVIKERTWSGRMKRLQEGKNPGFRPPYGLRTGDTPGSFAVVEDEAAMVRRIFVLYNQGMGYKAIAVQLTQDGVRFRGGRAFSAQTVTEILRNPLYVGRIVYGRVQRPRGGQVGKKAAAKPAQSSPTVVESGHVPHIVDPEQFQLAQANRSERARQRTPNRSVASDHLLTGILRCKGCGSAMMGRKKYGAAGREHVKQPPYYMCVGQRNKGKSFCEAGYIRQDYLDDWIVGRLMERYGGAAGAERFLQESEEALARQIAVAAQSLEAVGKELALLQKELEVIGRDYRREKLSLEEYLEQKAQVAREKVRLTAEASQLESSRAALQERKSLRQGRLETIDLVKRWEHLGQAERKHLLRELVDRLAVCRNPTTNQVEFDLVWVTDGQEIRTVRPNR
jgi:site-specific DNA recombinase